MIVIDASAVLEVLLQTPAAPALVKRFFRPAETLHAPHLLDLEVLQVLRRYVRNGSISASRAEEALEDLEDLGVERYGHELLVPRIWELRNQLTAYDAAYVALAETLRAPLVTLDARLARSGGHIATIELIR